MLEAELQYPGHRSYKAITIANLAVYGMRDQPFHYTPAQLLGDGSYPIKSGKQVLQLYGLDGNGGLNVMGLGVCVLMYRAIAWSGMGVDVFFSFGVT